MSDSETESDNEVMVPQEVSLPVADRELRREEGLPSGDKQYASEATPVAWFLNLMNKFKDKDGEVVFRELLVKWYRSADADHQESPLFDNDPPSDDEVNDADDEGDEDISPRTGNQKDEDFLETYVIPYATTKTYVDRASALPFHLLNPLAPKYPSYRRSLSPIAFWEFIDQQIPTKAENLLSHAQGRAFNYRKAKMPSRADGMHEYTVCVLGLTPTYVEEPKHLAQERRLAGISEPELKKVKTAIEEGHPSARFCEFLSNETLNTKVCTGDELDDEWLLETKLRPNEITRNTPKEQTVIRQRLPLVVFAPDLPFVLCKASPFLWFSDMFSAVYDKGQPLMDRLTAFFRLFSGDRVTLEEVEKTDSYKQWVAAADEYLEEDNFVPDLDVICGMVRVICAYSGLQKASKVAQGNYNNGLTFLLLACFPEDVKGKILTNAFIYFYGEKRSKQGAERTPIQHANLLYENQNRCEVIIPNVPTRWKSWFYIYLYQAFMNLEMSIKDILSLVRFEDEALNRTYPIVKISGMSEWSPDRRQRLHPALVLRPRVARAKVIKARNVGLQIKRLYDSLHLFIPVSMPNPSTAESLMKTVNKIFEQWMGFAEETAFFNPWLKNMEDSGSLNPDVGKPYKHFNWLFSPFVDKNSEEALLNPFMSISGSVKDKRRIDETRTKLSKDLYLFDGLMYQTWIRQGQEMVNHFFLHAPVEPIYRASYSNAGPAAISRKVKGFIEEYLTTPGFRNQFVLGQPGDGLNQEVRRWDADVYMARIFCHLQVCTGGRSGDFKQQSAVFLPRECVTEETARQINRVSANNFMDYANEADFLVVGVSKKNDTYFKQSGEYRALREKALQLIPAIFDPDDDELESTVDSCTVALNAFLKFQADNNATSKTMVACVQKPLLYDLKFSHLIYFYYVVLPSMIYAGRSKLERATDYVLRLQPSTADRKIIGGLRSSRKKAGDRVGDAKNLYYATSHDLRGLYSTESLRMKAPRHTVEAFWISSVLGHDASNIDVSKKYASKRVDYLEADDGEDEQSHFLRMISALQRLLAARLHNDRLVIE